MSRLRLVVFVLGPLVTATGVAFLIAGVAWGVGVAVVGFAIVVMSAPRLPGGDDSHNPGWTGSGPIVP